MTLTNSVVNMNLVVSTIKDSILNEEVIINEYGLIVTLNQSNARGRRKP